MAVWRAYFNSPTRSLAQETFSSDGDNNMIKRTASLAIGIPLVLIAGFASRVSIREHTEEPKAVFRDQTDSTASALTPAEERDLQTFVPQTLTWFARWSEPTNCLWNGEIVESGVAAKYNQFKFQEIPMGLDIGEQDLTVYFDPLHTYVRFKRLHNLGLSPGQPSFNCDSSYAEYKAAVELRNEQMSRQLEESRTLHRATNPEAAEAMDRFRKLHAPPAETKARRKEIRSYVLAPFSEDSAKSQDARTSEKKQLYKHILVAIRQHLTSSYEPGERIWATIPNFGPGDPSVYVLVKGRYYDTKEYILWVFFDRDPATGEYTAGDSKPLGLHDEIESLVPLIKKRQISEVKISCPKK
jgi:hypothetical protein